ncbi:hypothetical protein NITLEN_20586 [Nitrospira lenta]|uniref:Uncharacterized protein n=1 Tax=Nitrospira lenta TaxID=1436998 RepID=A0A330L6J3_9BACT|nr:hypothetical protein NITLEN_20586 [Nitrospira lenta]
MSVTPITGYFQLGRDFEEAAQSCGQFARVEGFHHVIVRACGQRLLNVMLAGICGEHNDRNPLPFGLVPNIREQLQAAHVRQHDVEQDQARRRQRINQVLRLVAIGRMDDVVSGALQEKSDQAGGIFLVFRHQ